MAQPKNKTPAPHQGGMSGDEIKRADQRTRQAPYSWLSDVENMLVRIFVDDSALLERARCRVACRGTATHPVKITLPPNRRGKLNVASVADTVTHLARIADRPLNEQEEAEAQTKAAYWRSNRDLLAHRIGRESATIRWKGCSSDEYGQPLKVYQRRLAVAGEALSIMGGIPNRPEAHGVARNGQESKSARTMEQREADAQANAFALVGGQ